MSETSILDESKHETINVVVNGEAKSVRDKDLTYDEVVALAYPVLPAPDSKFVITYRKAKEPKHEGILVQGEIVEVKEGTVFNVVPSGKS